MSFGFRKRDIWTWYCRPPTSTVTPSVSASWITDSLLPQPATASARTHSNMNATRRIGGRRLQPADGCARTAVVILLEDRLQARERALEPALEPAAAARERLHQAIGGQRRLALGRDLDARGAGSVRVQRPLRPRLVAVELARAAGGDDPVRALDLDEGHVAPAEAVQRRVDLEARAGAAAVGVHPREPPLLQVVVGELLVVGDVREVLEDLLAGAVDLDARGDGIHRERMVPTGGGRSACARSSAPLPRGWAGRAEADGTARTPSARHRRTPAHRSAVCDGSGRTLGAVPGGPA